MTFAEAPAPWPDELHGLLGQGVIAKVGFADDNGMNEWMWVHIKEVADDGSMEGVLLNQPFVVDGLRYGDRVTGFGVEHIYDVTIDAEAERFSVAALATRN